jgi:hypothetical protein
VEKENGIYSQTQTPSPLQGRTRLKLKCKDAANKVRYLACTEGITYFTFCATFPIWKKGK